METLIAWITAIYLIGAILVFGLVSWVQWDSEHRWMDALKMGLGWPWWLGRMVWPL